MNLKQQEEKSLFSCNPQSIWQYNAVSVVHFVSRFCGCLVVICCFYSGKYVGMLLKAYCISKLDTKHSSVQNLLFQSVSLQNEKQRIWESCLFYNIKA